MLISLGKLCQLFNTVLITLLISVYFQEIISYRREKNVLITKNKFVILYQVNQTFKAFLYNLTLGGGGVFPTMGYKGRDLKSVKKGISCQKGI